MRKSERGISDGVFLLCMTMVVMVAIITTKLAPYISEIVSRSQCMSYCESFASQTAPMDCVNECMSQYEE